MTDWINCCICLAVTSDYDINGRCPACRQQREKEMQREAQTRSATPTLVGLGAKSRVGKDTVADYLADLYGFQKGAFAARLKEAAKIICSWTDRHVYGELKEVVDPFWGWTPRDFLQRLGTEGVRNVFGENTWVKATMFGIEDDLKLGYPHVLTDVRFPQEAAAILEAGGELWRIDRPGSETMSTAGKHSSETAMEGFEGWTHVIENDGTLEDLYRKVDALLAPVASASQSVKYQPGMKLARVRGKPTLHPFLLLKERTRPGSTIWNVETPIGRQLTEHEGVFDKFYEVYEIDAPPFWETNDG